MSGCVFASCLKELETGADRVGDTGKGDEKPAWYDEHRFQRGQAFFRRHIAALGLAMHCSLVSGFAITNLLEPLVFTEKSNTAEKSFKRYVLTFYHIYQWMLGDLWDKTTKAYRSMRIVRGMHRNVAKNMNAAIKNKEHVSQYDMGLVQSGFFGAVVMYPCEFGIRCSREELADYVYAWRVIGYRLGIEDKYNICSGTFEQTEALVKEIERTCLIPALENPPKHFDAMADAYIDGVNQPLYFPLHSKRSILTLVWEGFEKTSPYSLGPADTLRYCLLKGMTLLMYYVPGFEALMNRLVLGSFEQRTEHMLGANIEHDTATYAGQR